MAVTDEEIAAALDDKRKKDSGETLVRKQFLMPSWAANGIDKKVKHLKKKYKKHVTAGMLAMIVFEKEYPEIWHDMQVDRYSEDK